jgi:hypothetical protein
MTETPPTAAGEDQEKAGGWQGYLPKLPSGWRYEVRLVSSDGHITVASRPAHPDEWRTSISDTPAAGKMRDVVSASFKAAIALAVGAAKSLSKISAKERELASERADLLDALGSEPTPPEVVG